MKKAFLSLIAASLLLGSYPMASGFWNNTYKKPLSWLVAGAAVISGFFSYAYYKYYGEQHVKNGYEGYGHVRALSPRSSQLVKTPQPDPNSLYDRIAGSMIAGAVGDALGRPTEFIKSVTAIYKQYPKGIRSFADFSKKDFMQGIAPYTDDTAMAKVTAQVICQAYNNSHDREKIMDALARAYVEDMSKSDGWAAPYRAPGNTCLYAIGTLKDRIAHNETSKLGWWKMYSQSGKGGGCGSVMRAHPFGLVFSHDPEKAVAWAAEHSYLTHSDPMALAACAAMAGGVAYAIEGKSPNVIVNYMINIASYYDVETAQLMEKARIYARDHISPKHVYEEFLGWDARTAIAATVYTFLMAPDNPREAIYLGVHTPGDSDSIASMAGALVGARIGFNRLKQEWPELDLNRLEGFNELMHISRDISCNARKKLAAIYIGFFRK
ncbi:MAG: ADP-ribosylglycohydrolase family protein [Candidatus Babeliales bacterium]